MSASAATVTTASITPEFFHQQTVRSASRAIIVSGLLLILLVGFGFRVVNLGAEALSEDEWNKLRAVEDYRAHGLTSVNGEHPMLMKALLTASLIGAESWNTTVAQAEHDLSISTEAALRLPGVLLGTVTSLLIFLVTAELFGKEVGLIAAALWALDPTGIGFNRIAKEDSFLLFFFLLANVFWLRGQRIAEAGRSRPQAYYWATAAAFGAMIASKYVPHFFCISISYYHLFQATPATQWRMGKRRWLIFFGIMGLTFLLCNPTILLPGTWHEMRIFAGEHRIGHDSYEFMGQLYRNQMTRWFKGVPWYFYDVFMAVKLPPLTIATFLIGLPFLLSKRLGDGRFFIFFWLFYWFFPFPLLGGKFTRYFTMALPVVLIIAAIGIDMVAQYLSRLIPRMMPVEARRCDARIGVALIVLTFSAYASASATPYYRLYTNVLGGGMARAGSYFPHDEFYDASTRETVAAMALMARPQARVASETPELVSYYARRAGRNDLVSVSLSDPAARREFEKGDVIIVARGRRYLSNDALVAKLQAVSIPALNIKLGDVPAAQVFVLDETSLQAISDLVNR